MVLIHTSADSTTPTKNRLSAQALRYIFVVIIVVVVCVVVVVGYLPFSCRILSNAHKEIRETLEVQV